MKRQFTVLVVLTAFAAGVMLSVALAQSQLFLWGKINWNTGYPANGLEVRLIQNQTRATVRQTYTNQVGNYAFFDIQGQPSDYSLEVWSGNMKRGELQVSGVPTGGEVPVVTIR